MFDPFKRLFGSSLWSLEEIKWGSLVKMSTRDVIRDFDYAMETYSFDKIWYESLMLLNALNVSMLQHLFMMWKVFEWADLFTRAIQ